MAAVVQLGAVAVESSVGAGHPVLGMVQEEGEEKLRGVVAPGPCSAAPGTGASADLALGSLDVVAAAGLGLPHGARTGSVAAEEG